MKISLSLSAACILAISLPGYAQHSSARDTFWSASDLVSVSSNVASKIPPKTAREHVKKDKAPDGSQQIAHVDPVLVAQNGYGEQPHLVRVSNDQLGLRYSLLLRNHDGEYREVPTSAVFHAGDHVRLSVMANQPGYLYVIQRGSTGNWSPIFPTAGAGNGVNKVEAGQLYQIPNGKGTWLFDQNAGEEKLFLILSREPLQDLDSTIQRLKAPAAAAPQQPAPVPQGPIYEAANHIPDDLVQRLASRDLVLAQEQQVDEKPSSASSGEQAVYVVSKGSANAGGPQVISQLILHHE